MAQTFSFLTKDDQRSLTKRYLFWLYKTTKDELDKIDRKFTQLDIDKDIEKNMSRDVKNLDKSLRTGLSPFLKEWREYIFQKESDAQKLKFKEDGSSDNTYVFLHLKLKTILSVAERRLGKKTVEEFKKIYEETALKAILQDTSGRR